MKSILKNKWFWILVAVAVVVTFIVARSKAGNTIAATTTKVIPFGGSAATPSAGSTLGQTAN